MFLADRGSSVLGAAMMENIEKLEITDCHGTNIHWNGSGEFTLCGMENFYSVYSVDGTADEGCGPAKKSRKRVNCADCQDVVDHVKKIIKQERR